MDIKAIVKADPSALFMQKISERLYPLTDIPWTGLVTVCKQGLSECKKKKIWKSS